MNVYTECYHFMIYKQYSSSRSRWPVEFSWYNNIIVEDVSCILRLHLLFYNVLLVSNRWMCGGIVESTISGALLSDRGTGHWAYKSYDVTTPLTTQTVSPRGSRSPCPAQKGIIGFWGKIISVLSVALSLRLGLAVVCFWPEVSQSLSSHPDKKGILGKDYLCVVGRLVPEAGLAVVCCWLEVSDLARSCGTITVGISDARSDYCLSSDLTST